MTLDEAIKDLQDRVDGEFCPKDIDRCKDMKLGIKAMKRIAWLRRVGSQIGASPLPGETEV